MRNMQKGFTLFELMIVVVMIGILAAIAVPQYQDYITRAKWQDNIARVLSYKTAIAECLQNNNGFITLCDTPAQVVSATGATFPPIGGNLSALTQTGTTGALVLTGTASVASCVVTLTPSAGATSVTWSYTNSGIGCDESKTGVRNGPENLNNVINENSVLPLTNKKSVLPLTNENSVLPLTEN